MNGTFLNLLCNQNVCNWSHDEKQFERNLYQSVYGINSQTNRNEGIWEYGLVIYVLSIYELMEYFDNAPKLHTKCMKLLQNFEL